MNKVMECPRDLMIPDLNITVEQYFKVLFILFNIRYIVLMSLEQISQISSLFRMRLYKCQQYEYNSFFSSIHHYFNYYYFNSEGAQKKPAVPLHALPSPR